MMRRLSPALLLLLPLLIAECAWAGDSGRTVDVEPDLIQVGIFFSGHQVRVKAETGVGQDLIIRVTGDDEPLALKKKGKNFGFLWMNVGELRYEAVPSLYILGSTRRLEEISDPETLNRLLIGFDALRERIPPEVRDGRRELFGELVKLKEKDRLFVYRAGGIEATPLGAGRQESSFEFLLPAKTPVGEYTVDVYGFQDGAGTLLGTAKIRLERSSAIAFIISLIVDHSLLYGCLAVVVAILAGLFTGIIFGMRKGGSH
jgi:uncharacterized protein (TIGR02186 family)